MVFALTTSHEIGLATMGGLFIAFALLSSFFFPRFSADFPSKKGLRWYIPLSVVFFVAMLSAVLIFGKEKKEAEAAAPPSVATKYAGGDVAAGKTEFATAGCAACHTFKPAGTSATIGPNLDDLATYAQKAGEPLADFTVNAIIKPPPSYVPPGFANTMPTNFGTSLTTKQISDLVAFLDAPA
ncbi:MAG TPA: cytochrome c [Gaiellaceae bacterium]|jgi:mono/diheme cytochrome c family protein